MWLARTFSPASRVRRRPRPTSKPGMITRRRGASRSMMISIDEMAENAKKMIAGETIVELDVNVLDRSFVADRIDDDEEDYVLSSRGDQSAWAIDPDLGASPPADCWALHDRVRPSSRAGRQRAWHPCSSGGQESRGHRPHRRAGAGEYGACKFVVHRKGAVRQKAVRHGADARTRSSRALTIDDTLLSRMLSVAETVPATVIEAIGAAKTIGRDRWEELKKQVKEPAER